MNNRLTGLIYGFKITREAYDILVETFPNEIEEDMPNIYEFEEHVFFGVPVNNNMFDDSSDNAYTDIFDFALFATDTNIQNEELIERFYSVYKEKIDIYQTYIPKYYLINLKMI